MAITKRMNGRTVKFSIEGAITLGDGSGSLRQAFARALHEGARDIEVHAGGVRYLDASGIGELVACRAMAVAVGARFRLRGVIGKALELLRITGLDEKLIRETAPLSAVPRRVA